MNLSGLTREQVGTFLTHERNGWEPGTTHSQWTDLGPVT